MSQDRSSEFFALAQTVPVAASSPSAITSDGTGSIRSGDDDPLLGRKNPSLHRAPTMPHSNVHHHHPTTPQPGTGTDGGGGGAYSELREFHATASSISTDIARTSGMLSELTHLVRRRNLFVDDTDRVNHLVISIKSNIEGLNLRLDEASATIKQRRRRMGRNSQAGQEATNLVDQLRQEFVRATKGFKAVLQQRSDGMKEAEGRKLEVFGQSAKLDDGGQRVNADCSLALGNRPPVYHSQSSGGLMGANNNGQNAGGGGMFGNSKMTAGRSPMMVPTLDLTSAYTGAMGMGGGDGKDGSIPAGESTSSSSASGGGGSSSLPRPRGVVGEGGGGSSAFGASSPYYNTVPGSPSGLRSRSGSNVMSSSGTGGGGGGSGNLPLYSGSSSTLNTPGGAGPNSVNPMMQPLTPIEIQRMEEQSGTARQMQLIPDQDYLRDRADAMSAVETNIVELGTIFNKLAVMVSEHREMVQRVEDNVEDASDNITLSLGVLTDTLDNLRTNRALFMKVFGILVVFIILFVTFFA